LCLTELALFRCEFPAQAAYLPKIHIGAALSRVQILFILLNVILKGCYLGIELND
jgi:hypothetical protein